MKPTIIKAALATLLFAGAASAASAGGYGNGYVYWQDGYQSFHSRAVAGAAPNSNATFIYGVRCSYEYRIGYGGERVRVKICN
ncbi:MAG: hypothetical protein R3D32_12965 [Nitratireductor sp.]